MASALVFKFGLSILLSAPIGFDRTFSKDQGGFASHCLVSVAACSYGMVEGTAGHVTVAISALAVATVFKSDSFVRGTNNALAIWIVGSIGLNIAFGEISRSVAVCLFTLAIQLLNRFVQRKKCSTRACDSNSDSAELSDGSAISGQGPQMAALTNTFII